MAAEDGADVQVIETGDLGLVSENDLNSPDKCRSFLDRFLHERPRDSRDPAVVGDASLLVTMLLKKPDIKKQLPAPERQEYERRAQAILERYYPERIYGMCADYLENARRLSSGDPLQDASMASLVLRGVDSVLLQIRQAQKFGVPLDVPQIHQKISVFTEAAVRALPTLVQRLKSGNHAEMIYDLAAQVENTVRTFRSRGIAFGFRFPNPKVMRGEAEALASVEILNANL